MNVMMADPTLSRPYLREYWMELLQICMLVPHGGRCATSGYVVHLTFDLDAVTLMFEKLVRTISHKVLGPAASNLVCRFPISGRCAPRPPWRVNRCIFGTDSNHFRSCKYVWKFSSRYKVGEWKIFEVAGGRSPLRGVSSHLSPPGDEKWTAPHAD